MLVAQSASCALSGLIDWWLAAVFIAGGIAGGLLGARAAKQLSTALSLCSGCMIMTLTGMAGARSYMTVSGDVQPGRT